MTIAPNRSAFFAAVRATPFGGSMRQYQVDGVNALIDAWETYAANSDPRFVACSLGEVFWESGRTMQPIAEVGKGAGHAYGQPAGPYGQVYYGRGQIQETWLANYQKSNERLHAVGILKPSEDLVKTPDLMLRMDVSAASVVLGMVEGWWTGHKLADYFAGTTADWVDSRRIVNGVDHAELIASYGLAFLHAIQVGGMISPATTAGGTKVSDAATAPAAPAPATAPVPTVQGPVKVDWGDWLVQAIEAEKPIIEGAASAGINLVLSQMPFGAIVETFIGPQVISQYVDQALKTVEGVAAGQSLTASGAIETMAANLINQYEPQLAAMLGANLNSMISGAVAKLGAPKT